MRVVSPHKDNKTQGSQGILDQETTQDLSLNACLVHSVRNKVKSGEISRAASVLPALKLLMTQMTHLRKLEAKRPVRRSISTSFQPHFQQVFQPLQISTETFTISLRDCPNGSSCGNDD